MITVIVCTKCKVAKPATTDYFKAFPRKLNGLNSWCLECDRRQARETMARRRADPIEAPKVLAAKRRHSQSAKGRETKRLSSLIDNQKRKNRIVGNRFLWDKGKWANCLDYWKNECAYCGEVNVPLTQEHVHPISREGCPGTVPWNIVPACQACNSAKNDRLIGEWDIAASIALRVEAYLAQVGPWL